MSNATGGFSIAKSYSRTKWGTKASRPSYRGADYLIVALYYARLSPTAINVKLDPLTSFLGVCLEERKAFSGSKTRR